MDCKQISDNHLKFDDERSHALRPETTSSSCGGASTSNLNSNRNIHINNMYVYNFLPDANSTPIEAHKPFPKYFSPAVSSGPICRICHEGDMKEELVSPCLCAGTVGLVHTTCMEQWLATKCDTDDKCEICDYAFVTVRHPKSLLEWIRSDDHNTTDLRSVVGDLTCFLLLTPLAIVSSFLSIEGAKRQVKWGNSIEAGCLTALATFIVTLYLVWNLLTIRYHTVAFLKWRSENQIVKLLNVHRVSTPRYLFPSPSSPNASFTPNASLTPNVVVEIDGIQSSDKIINSVA